MDRRSRHRIGKCEELLSAALKERDKRLKQSAEALRTQARSHATAVAAIVLSGQPSVDEPLNRAWARALQHYGIHVNHDQMAAAQRLVPIVKADAARFTKIFSTAPVWLLQFTGMAIDARPLGFGLPDISKTLRWGSAGYEDARRWPLLPLVTMMAGDPIPDSDPRRFWVIVFSMTTSEGHPIIDFADTLSREDEEIRSHSDPFIRDIFLALDLDRKPEKEWSHYEKRRMRKLAEWLGLHD
jgi:hypothetical protein